MEKLKNGTEVLIFKDPYNIIESDYTFGIILEYVSGDGSGYWDPITYKVKDIDGNERVCLWDNIMEIDEYKLYLDSESKSYDTEIEELIALRIRVNERIDRLEKESKCLTLIRKINK